MAPADAALRAAELDPQQAAWEAAAAASLALVTPSERDAVWAATLGCGLGEEATHSLADRQTPDSRLLAAAAQRNELLRERALPIPWDSITMREIIAFWQTERGVVDAKVLQQLLKFAAKGKCHTSSNSASNWRDTSHTRRMAEAYDAAAARLPPSLDVNRLLSSHMQYMSMPRNAQDT